MNYINVSLQNFLLCCFEVTYVTCIVTCFNVFFAIFITAKFITLLNTHINWCSKTKETEVNNGNDENKNKNKIESKENPKIKHIHCSKYERKFNKEPTFNMHMKNAHEETSIEMTNKESQKNVTFHTEKRNLRSYKKSSSAQGPNN